MAKGKGRPISKLVAVVFFFLVVATAGINFYLLFLLGQDPIDIKTVRIFAGVTAGIILTILVLLITLFIFSAGAATRAFLGKSGIMSIFIILLLAVVMGLDFALLPMVKTDSSEDSLSRARLFAGIAAGLGTFVFLLVGTILIARLMRANKKKKAKEEGLENLGSSDAKSPLNKTSSKSLPSSSKSFPTSGKSSSFTSDITNSVTKKAFS